MGVGFKVQVKVNRNRSMRYLMGFMACVGLACDPWPPQHQPHHLVATAGGGGAGNARRLTTYKHDFKHVCVCARTYILYIYIYIRCVFVYVHVYIYTYIYIDTYVCNNL